MVASCVRVVGADDRGAGTVWVPSRLDALVRQSALSQRLDSKKAVPRWPLHPCCATPGSTTAAFQAELVDALIMVGFWADRAAA
jgi:hypothetical protein